MLVLVYVYSPRWRQRVPEGPGRLGTQGYRPWRVYMNTVYIYIYIQAKGQPLESRARANHLLYILWKKKKFKYIIVEEAHDEEKNWEKWEERRYTVLARASIIAIPAISARQYYRSIYRRRDQSSVRELKKKKNI